MARMSYWLFRARYKDNSARNAYLSFSFSHYLFSYCNRAVWYSVPCTLLPPLWNNYGTRTARQLQLQTTHLLRFSSFRRSENFFASLQAITDCTRSHQSNAVLKPHTHKTRKIALKHPFAALKKTEDADERHRSRRFWYIIYYLQTPD